MEIRDGEYVLSTGRTVYANAGVIGLSPNGGMYEGYDGGLCPYVVYEEGKPFNTEFTPEEVVEIAEYMVQRWQEVAERRRRQ